MGYADRAKKVNLYERMGNLEKRVELVEKGLEQTHGLVLEAIGKEQLIRLKLVDIVAMLK